MAGSRKTGEASAAFEPERIVPYGRQEITGADIDAVVSVLRSNHLTQGPMVPCFETAIATRVGAGFAVASNSGTSSLHLACRALGVGPGDLVWTSAVTFVASANCALYCGAEIDFVDIDPVSYNISADTLAQKLEIAKRNNRLPKVVIPVHLAGHPADMAEIHALSQSYGFKILEDASHAIGGSYRDDPVGNCRYSDIAVFSFHPVKIITTGEGGVAVTNVPSLARRMALLNSHGVTRDPAEMERSSDGPWYYEQIDLGHNYRMTEIQAALGLAQLDRLDAYIARRHFLAERYDDALAELPITTPTREHHDRSSFHLYIIRVDAKAIAPRTHREVFEHLRADGVLANLHYIPVYRHPYFRRLGFCPKDFPVADRYYAEAISLPLYATLSEDDQDYVIACLKRALEP